MNQLNSLHMQEPVEGHKGTEMIEDPQKKQVILIYYPKLDYLQTNYIIIYKYNKKHSNFKVSMSNTVIISHFCDFLHRRRGYHFYSSVIL